MASEEKAIDRTKELRGLILEEVHAGMRRNGLAVPMELKAQHDARKRFLIGAITEDEELYPDWLWAQLALLKAEQTPKAERQKNFRRIESILERIRSL